MFNRFMINTGSKDLDEFLGGYGNNITIIYGKAATGKTTCCMLATLEQLKQNKKVIYLDTENDFSLDRFKQLAKDDYKKYLDNLFLLKINNFKSQSIKIKELSSFIEKGSFSLVIIDTIGIYYRRLVKRKKDLADNMLISQLKTLKNISNKIPVLITNQVYKKIDEDKDVMLANNIVNKFSNCLIELNHDKNRKIKILKPVKKEMLFEIREEGIFRVEH